MKNNQIRLSADAYSGFHIYEPNYREYETEIENFYFSFITEQVPKITLELQKELKTNPNLPWQGFLHQKGINYRLLGIVFENLTSPWARLCVMNEMVARTAKNTLRA